jgi:hypothetical protein
MFVPSIMSVYPHLVVIYNSCVKQYSFIDVW